MTTTKIRNIIRNTLIAQGGKLYGYNYNNIASAFGCSYTELQNTYNYYRFSPQQASFRKRFNIQ